MKSDRKRTILFIIILLVMSMGIGYAFLTTTLSIDGVSDIDSATWDVHWDNLEVSSYSVSGDKVITPATIGNNGTSISYHVKLDPGEYYLFTIDAVNDGTLDAVIDDISITVNNVETELPSYLIQILNYHNSMMGVSVGNYLPAGTSYTYDYELYYRDNLDIDELPTEDQSLSISVNVTYVQTKIPFYNNTYVYGSAYGFASIGERLFDYGTYFDNYQDAMDYFGHNSFLRYYMVNNLVSTSEVGFKIDNQIYYVKGGDGGASFEANKTIAQQAFGSSNCYAIDSGYSCGLDNYSLTLKTNGKVSFVDSYHYICGVENDGSGCYYFPGA